MALFLQILLFVVMLFMSLFLMLIVLIQRGKGGGLVGAFGGLGGSSAFGAKSTDVFVKITVITAIIWFAFCIVGRHFLLMNRGDSSPIQDEVITAPVNPGANAPAANAPVADAQVPVADEKAPTSATPASATPAPASATPAPAPATPAPAPATPAPAPAAPAPAPATPAK